MELLALRTFYDERHGLVELTDDMYSIVRQVRELYGGRVTVHRDDTHGHYYFVEHSEDSTERLIFITDHLDNRDLERLMKADSTGRNYTDPYLEAEKAQDQEQKDEDDKKMERLMEAGEGLAWAMGDGKFGPGYKQSIHIKRDISDTG
jgi:hypothetical protein